MQLAFVHRTCRAQVGTQLRKYALEFYGLRGGIPTAGPSLQALAKLQAGCNSPGSSDAWNLADKETGIAVCCQADESRTWNRDGVARGCFFGHGLSVRRMKFANLSKLPACPSFPFEDAHGGRCLWLLSLHQKITWVEGNLWSAFSWDPRQDAMAQAMRVLPYLGGHLLLPCPAHRQHVHIVT